MEKMKWDTWDELLLGGAILRHGTTCWDTVADELRSRTSYSSDFYTPQVCKAKYEDLQERYSGYIGWFEELKKKRIAELRQALEQAEDSIGSLESRLESLKADWKGENRVDYDSSRTVSLEHCQKSEGVECTSKDVSRDLSSAGSFTHQTQTSSSLESQLLGSKIPSEPDVEKLKCLISEKERDSCIGKQEETMFCIRAPSLKRRRGIRKRKDCSKDIKEESLRGSYLLGSADVLSASGCKEASTRQPNRTVCINGAVGQSHAHDKEALNDLMRIYTHVSQNECALVFCWRLDSQKRGRYKKLVRRHVDLSTVKSRIADGSIASAKELLRDLLLMASNGLVYYSKNTREHKAAARLRDDIKILMHDVGTWKKTSLPAITSGTALDKPPAKPRSIRAIKKPINIKNIDSVGSLPPTEPSAEVKQSSTGLAVVSSERIRDQKSDFTLRVRKKTRLK